ncbi:hypothetical protein BN8_01238 [Fibrisoma limi BUZ 3]|uniref:Secretion system C-terminal sorting domain-containing protein n=1 Tax=Fibrisoma limi BUZ 3 TaxID=1185876 RepID=I2GEC7_9BACT|nr:T9SS type A sorting domain-containing protein [Fibrisoma limi]CCH52252.1 hypothetical protein BN8_01238 [Fibrisoma limi BUZ 3]
MPRYTWWLCCLLCGLLSGPVGWSQGLITTESISTTSVCPAATIEVPFITTGAFNSGNAFTVQIAAEGGSFANIPTGTPTLIQTNRVVTSWRVTATVPTSTTAGGYRVRVTSSNPASIGSASASTVFVRTVSAPPVVAQTRVDLCQNGSSQPLQAIGTGLTWYEPSGVVSTTSPAPPTRNATQKPEGDIYYVTQTEPNGCESQRVAIQVFVQAVPTLSISGSTAVNLGAEVPLNLSFTGTGPYQFRLSNGLVGTATKDTIIVVLPEQTTTYQVVEVSNRCGTGSPGNNASATVTVNVPTITTLALTTTSLCAGTELSARFLSNGSFTPGSTFRLQVAGVVADSARAVFAEIPSRYDGDGLVTGRLPDTLRSGPYWVRVIATNPKVPVKGSLSPTTVTIRALPTATLTGNQQTFEGQPVSFSIVFTGEGPWTFTYRDTAATRPLVTVTTSTNPYVVDVAPFRTAVFRLDSVSNSCGKGPQRTNNIITITVQPVLGLEGRSLLESVDVYPVPASTSLTVRINGQTLAQPAVIDLSDLSGRPVLQRKTSQSTAVLELGEHPPGIYILHVRVGDRTAARRIVKQ